MTFQVACQFPSLFVPDIKDRFTLSIPVISALTLATPVASATSALKVIVSPRVTTGGLINGRDYYRFTRI